MQYRTLCRKCGARRIDRQLGLEPTPEAHVEKMVEVFREVRRVMRSDAVLFLNYGDSYAGGRSGQVGRPGETVEAQRKHRGCVGSWGLKPKDLVLMPFRIAKALQEPYYTGKIKSHEDRAWLAATIDGEGCIYIQRHPKGKPTGRPSKVTGEKSVRSFDYFGPAIKVTNTSEALVRRCAEIAGVGTIRTITKAKRQRPYYEWTAWSNEARRILIEIYPHLVAKPHEARLAIGTPRNGKDAEAAHESLKALHNGGAATIDFKPPASLFEPGWYLRSCIIWAKKNCMPESCRDRPTSSHEYIFLLTKSPRYFFDQEAVREKHKWEHVGAYRLGGESKNKGSVENPVRGKGNTTGSFRAFAAGGRNIRTVWNIATQPFPQAHFATFPEEIPYRCIKAGTSLKGCCPECGAPWERVVERVGGPPRGNHRDRGDFDENCKTAHRTGTVAGSALSKIYAKYGYAKNKTTGWIPGCRCESKRTPPDWPPPTPCTVLDPFMGSGTTLLVAQRLSRNGIGIELNPEYAEMARKRVTEDQPLFSEVTP